MICPNLSTFALNIFNISSLLIQIQDLPDNPNVKGIFFFDSEMKSERYCFALIQQLFMEICR
jgi:hypothetical protein